MAPPPGNEARIKEAKGLSKSNPSKAESLYKEVLAKPPGANEAALRDYENALLGLGELYRDNKKPDSLADLVKTSRTTLSSFAKAKTAKLGRLAIRSSKAIANCNQFASSLTTSMISRTASKPRSLSPNHV